ncbi:MAG: lipid A deacylase LpxR family protein, partial [Parvularculaceae bacterium]|nr:lipid A deacylase LpxR family protein [Parvularculaceae bacterium]
MKKLLTLSAVVAGVAPLAALAQDVVLDDPTATWSFTWENDGFFGSDQNYTSGLRLSYLSGNSEIDPMGEWVAKRVLGLSTDPSRLRVRKGVSIGQEIFTPEDGDVVEPLPDQHPYAGYLYLRFTRLIEQVDRVDQVAVELGVVGPSALGRQAQDSVHDFFDRERFLGWDNQIADTPAVNL